MRSDSTKDAGTWTDEAQANRDDPLQRQAVLKQVWTDFTASTPKGDFYDARMDARYQGLEAAGQNPIWKTFK
ncbi:MAG: hypothetical protein ACK4QW_16815 [Alphaproteobacteria bacterium]